MFLNNHIKNRSPKVQDLPKKNLKYTKGLDIIFSKISRKQKGAVKILVILVLPVLLGFAAIVIDAGTLYLNKRQLQTMADAGALAGAQDLPGNTSQAKITGKNYAIKNGTTTDTVTPTVVGTSNNSLKVEASRDVKRIFSLIFGTSPTTVKASATATVFPAGGARGVIPIGIVDQTLIYGDEVTMKYGGGGGCWGNYGALALGGTGAAVYEPNLKNGYSGTLTRGQSVPTEPGAMTGPTLQGLIDRIASDPFATYDTVKPTSERLVIVPLINEFQHGRTSVTITNFAVFFIEKVHGGKITGNFIEMVSGDAVPGTGPSKGLYAVKLTE